MLSNKSNKLNSNLLSLALIISLTNLWLITTTIAISITTNNTNTTILDTILVTNTSQYNTTGIEDIGGINNTVANNSLPDIISKENQTLVQTEAINTTSSTDALPESREILNTKYNESVISQTLPTIENDINDRINGSIVVNQLTSLSSNAIQAKPSDNPIGNGNDIATDLTASIGAVVSVVANNLTDNDNTSHSQVVVNEVVDQNQTNQSIIINPVLIKNETEMVTNSSRTEPMGVSGVEHRIKRSFLMNPLHSNLDEILNMRRQRRASMRYKRNTNYDDLLASILAQDDNNDNKYDNSAENNDALNTLALNYILNNMNSYDTSDNDNNNNKYTDLAKIKQYYDYILPLIETTDSSSDSSDTDDNSIPDDLPMSYDDSYSAIPVIPYSWPNRYQRIRRSYYNRYQNPLSVYTGLKRKRSNAFLRRGGEWGRIVGANSDRSAYDDEAQEANKIYSLASLLASDYRPESSYSSYGRRYKRSVKRSVKPSFKNM